MDKEYNLYADACHAYIMSQDKSVDIELSPYAKTADIEKTYLTKDDASKTYQPKGNYLTEHQSLADYAKSADVEQTYQKKGDYALKSDIVTYSAGENVVIDEGHKISVASKTIKDIATSALTEALIPDNAVESMDTLQEIAAWIQAHPGDAATMNTNINTVSGTVNTNSEAIKANSEQILRIQLNPFKKDKLVAGQQYLLKIKQLMSRLPKEMIIS